MEKIVPNVLEAQPKPTPREILQYHFTDCAVVSGEDIQNFKEVLKLRYYQMTRPLLPPDFFELAQQALAMVETSFQRNFEAAQKEVHRIHPPPPAGVPAPASNGGLALPPGVGSLLVPEGTRR